MPFLRQLMRPERPEINPIEQERMNTKTNGPEAEYIDATPTWAGILPVLLAAAENGSRPALAELQRMARQADLLQAYLADEKLAAKLRQGGVL